MVQKEVGNRIIAQPNNKEYGRLSIITQYHCKVCPLLTVPNTSFIPIPKVESIMIQFIPHNINNIYPKVNIKLLSLITKLAFCQRRKTIRNSLSNLFDIKDMIKHGIDLNLRAENLTINQFCILTKILHQKNINNIDFF